MSYEGISAIAFDQALRLRITACFAVENTQVQDHPESLVDFHKWNIAKTEGWAEAYEAAMAEEGRTVPPGADPEVITDDMIQDAVRSALGLS